MRMKKFLAVALTLAMVAALVPGLAVSVSAAGTLKGDNLISAGEKVFDGTQESIPISMDWGANEAVASKWNGWSVDDTNGIGNLQGYNINGRDMATLQFYRDKNKSTTLDKNTSFFDNAQSDTGIVKVTTPGYGDNTGFVMMDFYMKHGQDTDAGVADGCYHDYYFRDRNGVLIGSAVRMDKNGVVVKDSPSGSETNLGLLMTDENVAEHWRVIAANYGEEYYFALEREGATIFNKTYTGSFNGLGSFDVIMGPYNAPYTHTGLAELTIYTGKTPAITFDPISIISGNEPILPSSVDWNTSGIDFSTETESKSVTVTGKYRVDNSDVSIQVNVLPCTDGTNSGTISSTKGQNAAMFHRFNGDIKGKASFEFDVTYNVDKIIGNHYVGIGSKAVVAADGPVFTNGGNAIGLQGVNDTTGTLNFYGQSQFKINKGTKYRVFITTDTTSSTYSATVTNPDGNVVGSVNNALYRDADLLTLDGLSVVVNDSKAGDNEIVVENFRVSNTDGKEFTVSITGAGENNKNYTVVSGTSAGIPVPAFDGYVLKTRTAGDNIVNTRAKNTSDTLTLEYVANDKENLGTWAIRNNVSGDTGFNQIKFLGSHDSFTDKITGNKNYADEAGVLNNYEGSREAKLLPALAVNSSKAQSADALGQLNCGARYFDIRLSRQEDGALWTRHGLISEDFEGIAYTIAQFAKENPGEIIVLDFQHTLDKLYDGNMVVSNDEGHFGKTAGDDNKYVYDAIWSLLQKTGVADYVVGNINFSTNYKTLTNNGTKSAIVCLAKGRGANCISQFVNRGDGNGVYVKNSDYGTVTEYINNNYNIGRSFQIIHAFTTGSNLVSSANTNNPKFIKETNFQSWMEKSNIIILDNVTSNAPDYLAKLTEYTRDGFDGKYTNTVEGVTVEGPTASIPFSTKLTATKTGKDYTFKLTQFENSEVQPTGEVTLTFPDATGGIEGLKTVVYHEGEKYEPAEGSGPVKVSGVTSFENPFTVTTEAVDAKADAKLGYDGANLTLDFTLDDIASKITGADSFKVTVSNQDGVKVGEADVTTDKPNVILTPKDSNAIYTAVIEAVKGGANYSVDTIKASLYSEVVENLEKGGYSADTVNSGMIAKANEVISHGGIYFTESETLNDQTKKIVDVNTETTGKITVTVNKPYSDYGIGFILADGKVVVGSTEVAAFGETGEVYKSFTVNTSDNTVTLSGDGGAVTLSLDSVNIEFVETLINETAAEGADSAPDFVPEL